MRGAGDLLGDAQADYVKLIGVDLYQHLLGLALRTARGEAADLGPLNCASARAVACSKHGSPRSRRGFHCTVGCAPSRRRRNRRLRRRVGGPLCGHPVRRGAAARHRPHSPRACGAFSSSFDTLISQDVPRGRPSRRGSSTKLSRAATIDILPSGSRASRIISATTTRRSLPQRVAPSHRKDRQIWHRPGRSPPASAAEPNTEVAYRLIEITAAGHVWACEPNVRKVD